MVEYSLPAPAQPYENALQALGNKISSGRELSSFEKLMAFSLAGSTARHSYGPTPSEMTVTPPDLPENVKGILADYANI